MEEYNQIITICNKRTAEEETNWMLVYAYTMAGERKTAMDILNVQLEKCKKHVTAFMIIGM